MDNAQYPTGFPLLMLTLQKEASGTGSQNVPASPRRPVVKDKGRQRKCLYKTQTWHEYFHIQLKRYYGDLKLPFSPLKKISIFSPQKAKRACGVPQRYEQDLRHSMCFWLFRQLKEAVCDANESELLITWSLPMPHSIECFQRKDAHLLISMKGQENLYK